MRWARALPLALAALVSCGGRSDGRGRASLPDETLDEVNDAGSDAPIEPDDADVAAEFSHVEFERLPAYGFCIDEGTVRQASIDRDESSGVVLLSALIHLGWLETGAPDCDPGSRCEVSDTLGPMMLTPEEDARLRALFAAMPRTPCGGASGPCDPCVRERLTLDGVNHSSNACYPSHCSEHRSALMAIADFIDDFVP